ncbi:uncharacterized protein LOC144123099 [Amblyomma americanum]
MDMLLVSFVVLFASARGGYSAKDPLPANKIFILLNTKMKSYSNDYPLEDCAWSMPVSTLGRPNVNVTMSDGHILNLIRPGLKPRGWCSAPGWLGNELTVGCYSFFENVIVAFDIRLVQGLIHDHTVQIYAKAPEIDVLIELASELGGRPRLRTWLVRPFNMTTWARPPLSVGSPEVDLINASSYKCMYDQLWKVLLGKYKEDLSTAVGSQDSYIPPP